MLTVTYNRKLIKEDLYNCVFCSLSETLIGSVGGQGLSDLVAQLVGALTPGMCRAERDEVRSLTYPDLLINTIYLLLYEFPL